MRARALQVCFVENRYLKPGDEIDLPESTVLTKGVLEEVEAAEAEPAEVPGKGHKRTAKK